MNLRVKLTPEETRLRIIEVAEEQFRRVGYAKTAVADIAEVLGMSSGNVYRFFPTKSAINEAICIRILSEAHDLIDRIVSSGKSAPERLMELLLELNRFNRSRFIGERRVHEMVEVAMEENWSAVETHMAFVVERIGRIIADGIEAGVFRPCDPGQTAFAVKCTCTSILHPVMIAECMRHGRDMEQLASLVAGFVVNALKVSPP